VDFGFKDSPPVYETLERVGDFKAFFGLGGLTKDRAMPVLVGLGTSTVSGEKRRIHSMLVHQNPDGHAVVKYKEFDNESDWCGHWSGNDKKEIRLFRPGKPCHVTFVHCDRIG
jgi:hypothetical protein